MMELALASAIGGLVAAGVYLLLRARSFDVILGLTLLSYATNLLIFSAGRLAVGKPPVLSPELASNLDNYTDPHRDRLRHDRRDHRGSHAQPCRQSQ